MESGHLEHLYYGRKLSLHNGKGIETLVEKQTFAPGNTNVYDEQRKNISLEDVRLEMSSYGKGDIREPFVEVIYADGSYTSDFIFEDAEIRKEKPEFETLPGSYDETGEVEWLRVRLRDKHYNLVLEFNYYVFEECDVITRNAKLINESNDAVKLLRLLSLQIDYDTPDYVFTTFNGAWAREMKKNDIRMTAGRHVNASYTGTSSSRANPFVMMSYEDTTEDYGECYGFNLIYSGNHYEAVEVSSFGKTRLVVGINPQSFSFLLEPGDFFEAPEAIMTYSCRLLFGFAASRKARRSCPSLCGRIIQLYEGAYETLP